MMPSVFGIKLMWITGAILALTLAAALWRVENLSGKLDTERAEHTATKEALAREIEKGMGWQAAYEKALLSAEAHRQATQECLERALVAETARKEREALLQATQPRPRTEAEKQQVVNDATRARAADRLNRTF
jgi:hypothetical protein